MIRSLFWLVFVASLTGPFVLVLASAEETQLFRREFVPADEIESLARDLIPVKRGEFEELLKDVAHSEQSTAPLAWLAEARCQAAIKEQTLLCQWQWDVQTRSAISAILSFPGLDFPLEHARWQSDPATPARFGCATTGEAELRVDRAGVLLADSDIFGRTETWGARRFTLQLPPASRHSWTFQLPTGASLRASTGLLAHDQQQGITTWTASGATNVTFTYLPPGWEGSTAVLVAENIECRVNLTDLAADITLHLDVYREPLSELRLRYFGTWTPKTISLGESSPAWSMIGGPGPPELVVKFDPPLSGTNRRLKISGNGEVTQGTVEAPRVEVLGSAWLEGKISITPAADARCEAWQATSARLNIPLREARDSRDEAQWYLENPRASLQWQVKRRMPRTRATSATNIVFASDVVRMRQAVQLEADVPGAFQWEASVQDGWIVDSVSSVPAEALEHWEPTAKGKSAGLRVHLRRSPSASAPVRLLIAGHQVSSLAASFSGKNLTPLSWLASEVSGVTGLAAAAMSRLPSTVYETLPGADWSQLAPWQQQFFDPTDKPAALLEDRHLAASRFATNHQVEGYAAECVLELRPQAEGIAEEGRAKIIPASRGLDRVLILLHPPPTHDVQWRCEPDPVEFTAKPLGPGTADTGQLWEITFARTLHTAVELVAKLPLMPTATGDAIFLACPEAATQIGWIELRGNASWQPVVKQARNVYRVAGNDAPPNTKRWKYDPARRAQLAWRAADADESSSLVMIHHATLTSRWNFSGQEDEVVYEVSAPPHGRFELTLPDGARCEAVEVNDEARNFAPATEQRLLAVPLLGDSPRHRVRLRLRYPDSLATYNFMREPRWPRSSVPVARHTWRCEVPYGYRDVQLASADRHIASDETTSWWQTAFPSFANIEDSRLFLRTVANDNLDQREQNWGEQTAIVYESAIHPPHVTLLLLRTELLETVCYLLLVLGAAAIAIAKREHVRLALVTSAMLLLIAILLPRGLVPLPRVLVVATLIGWAWPTSMAARKTASQPATRGTVSAAAAVRVAFVLSMILSCWLAGHAWCQDKPRAGKTPPPIERVLIPVDEREQPVGDYVYLREDFFAQLHAQKQHRQTRQSGGLLCDVTYHLAPPKTDDALFTTLTVQLTVDLPDSGLKMFIPWSRTSAPLLRDQITHEKQFLPITWRADGSGFEVELPSGMRHKLEFTARLPSLASAGAKGLRWPTMPALCSRVSTDIGEGVWLRRNETDLVGRLIPPSAPQIVRSPSEIRIFPAKPLAAVVTPVSCKQLLWARLWPAGSVIEARWTFTHADPVISRVAIACPAGWELLAAAPGPGGEVRWQAVEQERLLTAEWYEGVRETSLRALFLRRQTSDTAWHMPRFEPLNCQLERQWEALSLADASPLEAHPTAGTERVDPRRFSEQWATAELPLQARVSTVSPAGPMALLPPHSPPAMRSRCELEATTSGDRWQYTARFVAETPREQTLRFHHDPQLEIESVAWQRDNQLLTMPWVRLALNEVALPVPANLTQDSAVVISGKVIGSGSTSRQFSYPRLAGTHVLSQQWTAWRDTSQDVRVQALAPWQALPITSDTREQRIHVGTWEWVDDQTPSVITWLSQPNQSQLTGVWLTNLTEAERAWKARFEAELTWQGGPAREFELTFPAPWRNVEFHSPDAEITSRAAATGAVKVLVRPRSNSGVTLHLLGSAQLTSESSELEIPQIEGLPEEGLERFFQVPTALKYRWTTQGVQESAPPRSFTATTSGPTTTYRATSSEFTIRLAETLKPYRAPRVVLAEYYVPNDNGAKLGRAVWWLIPQGRRTCQIEMPTGCQLLHARVDGAPEVLEKLSATEYSVALVSEELPQLVEVWFEVDSILSDATARRYPRPANWSVEREIAIFGERPETDDGVALARRAATATFLEFGSSDPPGERSGYRAWCRAWLELSGKQGPPSDVEIGTHPQLAQWDAWRTELKRAVDGASRMASPGRPLQESVLSPVENSSLPRQRSSPLSFVLPVFLWLGLVAGGWRLFGNPDWQELSRRYYFFAHVLLGVALVFTLSPWWIGGVLALLPAIGMTTWPWRVAHER